MALQKLTEAFTLFFQSFFSIVKVILLSKFFVRLPKVEPGQECVILGNGPSFSSDLETSRGFISSRKKFCVNFFGSSEEYSKLQPDYYILAAPEFWLETTTELFHNKRMELANKIVNETTWNIVVLIPFQAKKSEFCSTIITNKNVSIIHYNNTPVEGYRFIANHLFRTNLGMPRPHNVLIPSIYLALNFGFKKIVLFGADHSWHEQIKIDNSNKVTVNHEHFYDKQEVRMQMYKLDGKEYFIHDIFRKLYFAFKGYFILENYSLFLSAKILNGSSKSYIDAFEKVIL